MGTKVDQAARSVAIDGDYTLIVGAAPAGTAEGFVSDLCRGASSVIVADGGMDVLFRAGVAPDVLAGDLDSAAPESIDFARRRGVRQTLVPSQKDFTDLELAIDIAREQGARQLLLCCVSGGRLDHMLAVLGACEAAADLQPIILDAHETVCVLSSAEGARRRIGLKDLGLEEGETFSVISTAGCTVDEVGVRYPLRAHRLEPLSGLGVSNVVTDESAYVCCEEGVALIIASR